MARSTVVNVPGGSLLLSFASELGQFHRPGGTRVPIPACDWCVRNIGVPYTLWLYMATNKKQTNSVALSPRANYTDWATATFRRILVPTFADRGVCRGQCGGSPTAVNLSFLPSSLSFILTRPEWNPFQTHCYSENLAAPGIAPGTSESAATNSVQWHSQMGHFLYVTIVYGPFVSYQSTMEP
jgi:hypothetical protein